jgi:hypothetical protein
MGVDENWQSHARHGGIYRWVTSHRTFLAVRSQMNYVHFTRRGFLRLNIWVRLGRICLTEICMGQNPPQLCGRAAMKQDIMDEFTFPPSSRRRSRDIDGLISAVSFVPPMQQCACLRLVSQVCCDCLGSNLFIPPQETESTSLWTNYQLSKLSKHSTEQLCLVAQVGDAIQRKLMQTTVPNIRVTTSTITVLCLDERLRTRCYSHYHNHQRYSRPKFINQHRHSLD